MKIKYFTENCCHELLTSLSSGDLSNYEGETFPENDFEFITLDSNLKLVDSINLEASSEKDYDSSVSIFESLKSLDRVRACDRRLWTTLTHTTFFSYVQKRWMEGDYSKDSIIKRFHFEGSGLETRMRNAISRLWWAAKLTYDETRENPYELTKTLWSKQDLIQNLLERSYGTYPNLLHGFLEVYAKNQTLSESDLRKLYTGLNALGGVKILPLMTKEEIKNNIQRIAEYSEIKLRSDIDDSKAEKKKGFSRLKTLWNS